MTAPIPIVPAWHCRGIGLPGCPACALHNPLAAAARTGETSCGFWRGRG